MSQEKQILNFIVVFPNIAITNRFKESFKIFNAFQWEILKQSLPEPEWTLSNFENFSKRPGGFLRFKHDLTVEYLVDQEADTEEKIFERDTSLKLAVYRLHRDHCFTRYVLNDEDTHFVFRRIDIVTTPTSRRTGRIDFEIKYQNETFCYLLNTTDMDVIKYPIDFVI